MKWDHEKLHTHIFDIDFDKLRTLSLCGVVNFKKLQYHTHTIVFLVRNDDPMINNGKILSDIIHVCNGIIKYLDKDVDTFL